MRSNINNNRNTDNKLNNSKGEENTLKSTFKNLLIDYTVQAALDTNSDDYAKALQNLATACAYSVLKKCIMTGGDRAGLLTNSRRSIAADTNNIERVKNALNNAHETVYNASGDRVRKVKNKDLADALKELCGATLGDGLDLVNEAVVAILTETEKQSKRTYYRLFDKNNKIVSEGYERPENIPDNAINNIYLDNGYYLKVTRGVNVMDWMETPYNVRRLKRRVWIKTADSVNGWETTTTTPIQEVYQAIRKYIHNNGSVKTVEKGHTYLEAISKDTESDACAIIYRRFAKYADIGGNVADAHYQTPEDAVIHGYREPTGTYTADETTADEIDKLISKIGLSAQQLEIIKLRLCGYGKKAIATRLGVREDNIKNQLKRIRAKAAAAGLNPKTNEN